MYADTEVKQVLRSKLGIVKKIFFIIFTKQHALLLKWHLKQEKFFGTPGIANYFLKVAFPVISDTLCDILKLSLSSGVFPHSWKAARVAPIFKEGPSDERSNYRSTSVYQLFLDYLKNLCTTNFIDT